MTRCVYLRVLKEAGQQVRNYTSQSRAICKMGEPSVYITNCDIPDSALKKLTNYRVSKWNEPKIIPRDVLLKNIAGKNAVIITSVVRVDEEFLKEAGPQLKVISTISVGYDHVDLTAVKAHGVRLGNTPDVLTDAVAELTIALLLSITRRLFDGSNAIAAGEWPNHFPLFWMNGMGLKDSVVGIVGLGRIGIEIARRLVPFKVKEILYTSRTEKKEAKEFKICRKVQLQDLLENSDIVIIMVALNKDTKHLIGEAELKMMKPTAFLINSSRGAVLDQDALIEALKAGTIAGAALDVMTPEPLPPNHELLKLKNCCLLPHMGSSVLSTRMEMVDLAVRNVIAALKGQPMPAEVLYS